MPDVSDIGEAERRGRLSGPGQPQRNKRLYRSCRRGLSPPAVAHRQRLRPPSSEDWSHVFPPPGSLRLPWRALLRPMDEAA